MVGKLPKVRGLEGTLKKEVWLENTLPKVIVGSKAHLKKEVWLENSLPKVVDGSKEH